MDKISIIVPCWNEEAALPIYYKEMSRIIGQMDTDVELIFVDDGSADKTLEEMKKLHEIDARCRYLSFSRNFGTEAAIYAGLTHAEGDYIAVMDVDLQDPPSGDVPDIKRRRLRQRGNETFHQSRRAGDTVVPVQTVLSFYQQNI